MKNHFSLTIYYFLVIMYLELCHKYLVYQRVLDIGLLYTTLLSFFIALLLSFFSRLANPKRNRKIMVFLISVITFLFIGNFLYYNLFSVPFTFRVTKMAGQAFEFINVLLKMLITNILNLFLLSVPLTITLFLKSKITIKKIFYYEKKNLIKMMIITYLITILSFMPLKDQNNSAYNLYWNQNGLSNAISTFGLLTAQRIEIQRMIFGFEEKVETFHRDREEKEDLTYNKMDIDFESLLKNENDSKIRSVYQYFKNEPATNQNEYTGIYKGKNLIFILAESFNQIAVSEELTPTLYQLTHTGFQFNNFYSPVFLSTTGGEFQAMTGLVPNADTLNEWYKGNVTLPFSIGNTLSAQGYTPNAYHNYEATFYNRVSTMPTLGFPNYLACENGLEEDMMCGWENDNAPDDEDLIDVTYDLYSKEEPFVTYYITMSGHFPYNLSEKTRNYKKVKDLPYSDDVKAYLATQIDLDEALTLLIKNLKDQNILDDTVICLVGDHYPYALSIDHINELSKEPREEQFEIHHSNLVIWNNDSKKIEVDKVGSQIDILPTLLNLFGIEYDSRLLIGHDIFSEEEGLAIFADMSWISDSGIYNANTRVFTPKKEVSGNYVSETTKWVNNSSIVSNRIVTYNIYDKIFNYRGDN